MTKREYLSKRGIISMFPAWVAEEEADEAFKASVDNLAEHYDTIWTEDEGVTYAPVRHGKWVEDDVDRWRCSECNKGNHYAYSWDSTRGDILQDHYCPNCGARMDKEVLKGSDDD